MRAKNTSKWNQEIVA